MPAPSDISRQTDGRDQRAYLTGRSENSIVYSVHLNIQHVCISCASACAVQGVFHQIGGCTMGFEGFSKEALRFLLENRMNNNREWYEAHKHEYRKYVYEPFVELVKALAPSMKEIDDGIITVPSKIISRVRRDTRFTKDKSLYRDNAWIVFLRDKSQMSVSPCFWFELGQYGISYGVGYYKAQNASMAKMRELILDRHPSFLAAQKAYENQDEFVIGGEEYKRTRYADQPDNIRQWLNRKNIYFENVRRDFGPAFSAELPDMLTKGFRKLKPVYDFLLLVESSV